jgi:hypothetical protein
VLFTYVASLASNEIFSLSTKMIVATTGTIRVISVSTVIKGWTTIKREATTYNTTVENEIITVTRKLYSQPNGILTILITLYLLMP